MPDVLMLVEIETLIREVETVEYETLTEEVEVVEIVTEAEQGPPGPPGPPGDSSTLALHLVTTNPLRITAGQMELTTVPLGGVVWNMALVYVDLTPADFDADGALLTNRSYVVEDHLVRTIGSTVFFTDPPPHDGAHGVVSYLTAAV